jgi:regulator of replication initiation timing
MQNGISSVEQFLKLPNLGEQIVDKKEKRYEIYKKILDQKIEDNHHINTEIDQLKESEPQDKDTWERENYKQSL